VAFLTFVAHHLRSQRTVGGRLAFEGLLVLCGAALAAVAATLVTAILPVERDDTDVMLAVLAAGLGTAAVGLGQTAGRLTGNIRASWLIPALALYSVIVIPGTADPPGDADDVASLNWGSVVAFLGMTILMVVAIRPPARWGTRRGWICAAVFALLDLALTGTVMESPLPVNLAVLAWWASVSTAVVVAGYRLASPPVWRIGLGFGLIAVAHLHRVAAPHVPSQPSLVFAGLRLLGIVVVLLGMAQLLRRALDVVLTERFIQQEELRLAGLRADRLAREAAERDHELRNGLSGLTGMTQLLGAVEAGESTQQVRSAVVSELDRLTDMLRRYGQQPTPGLFDAARVVQELVDLWRVAGLAIDATIVPGLMVRGRSSSLAQVVTNLLMNCSRHAPGSRVRVIARQEGEAVVIQVADDGPHLAAGHRPPATEPGQGIGLRLSARLLEDDGGVLRLHPHDDGSRPGFTAVVELPGAHAVEAETNEPTAASDGRSSQALDR
jgi:two-component system, OmpR family, sensor kinase